MAMLQDQINGLLTGTGDTTPRPQVDPTNRSGFNFRTPSTSPLLHPLATAGGEYTGGDYTRTPPDATRMPAAPPPSAPAPSTTSLWNAGNRASGLQAAFARGLRGEEAVNFANSQDGGGYAFYADKNVYGIPGGQGYILQNGQGGFDWSPGHSEGGGASGGGSDWTGLFQQLVNSHLESLSHPAPNPQLDALTAQLAEKAKAQESRAAEFAGTLRNRATELNAPAYSDRDAALMRTQATEQLERRRQQTLQNRTEAVYQRGFAPTSGLVQGVQNNVNDQFEGQRTTIESNLLNNMLDESQRRKDQAVQLEGLAQQALNGGDLGSLQMNSTIADYERQGIDRAAAQERERLQTSMLPIEQQQSALASSNAVLNGSGSSNALQSFFQMLSANNQQNATDQAGRNNNMAGYGALLKILMGM